MLKPSIPLSLCLCAALVVPGMPPLPVDDRVQSTIAFASTRDDPSGEIYLMNMEAGTEFTAVRRLTANTDPAAAGIFTRAGEWLPSISPDGKKIAFDSTELSGRVHISDLFVMDADGGGRTWVIRGSSATWSPDSKYVAFHASASGTGRPIKTDPGAATIDSDIFIINLDDVLAVEDPLARPAWRMNLTNNSTAVDDDPDWSPDGLRIAFTSHAVTDNHLNSVTAEIYVRNADGSGDPNRLTFNGYEERGPAWSNDGTRIAFMCRIVGLDGALDFEICVMNADGSDLRQLTDNTMFEGTPAWSPDDTKIAFSRTLSPGRQQLFWMNADGTGEEQLTNAAGTSFMANWGKLVLHGRGDRPASIDLWLTATAAAAADIRSSRRDGRAHRR